jgi:hypothetical protein
MNIRTAQMFKTAITAREIPPRAWNRDDPTIPAGVYVATTWAYERDGVDYYSIRAADSDKLRHDCRADWLDRFCL